ncbi:hypothetical protein EVA_13855 [gut metagenome]|uniref:Uncharacterized protein n=1 Tax=gut metagenome TaxID=749906 RepID=J9CDN0_9ZZZZ
MMMKLITVVRNAPTLKDAPPSTISYPLKSWLPNKPKRGLSRSLTSESTIPLNAPPMTTPTAMSMTLPRMAKSLNSCKNFFIDILLV